MSRLQVEAVSAEWNPEEGDIVYDLLLLVSVSRTDSGAPVSGLTAQNFRVCGPASMLMDYRLQFVYEQKWDPNDAELSGCYRLSILRIEDYGNQPRVISRWRQGSEYYFGLQVRVFHIGDDGEALVTDQGQTVVRVLSIGE